MALVCAATQAADGGSDLLHAPSISGSPAQILTVTLHREALGGGVSQGGGTGGGESRGGQTGGGGTQQGEAEAGQQDMVVNAIGQQYAVPQPGTLSTGGKCVKRTAGSSCIRASRLCGSYRGRRAHRFAVAGDASFMAYVNGHAVGGRHNTDFTPLPARGAVAGATVLSFTAPCDSSQVFAISAESAASMPSMIAQVGVQQGCSSGLSHCGVVCPTLGGQNPCPVLAHAAYTVERLHY